MTCEAIWFKRLMKDLQVEVSELTMIFYDNLNSIQLARNLLSTLSQNTLRFTIILYASEFSLVNSNLYMF